MPPGCFCGHPGTQVVLDVHPEMAFQFGGQIRIVLLELRTFAINHPILYTHLGLNIADASLVVVKTASNFQFFEQWRTGLIRVDSPGMTQSDLTAFHWQRIPRPMYPFDDVPDWQPN